MNKLKKITAGLIKETIKEKFGSELLSEEEIVGMLEYPPDRTMGDIALPCFKLSRTLRNSPVKIAEALAEGVKCEEQVGFPGVSGERRSQRL